MSTVLTLLCARRLCGKALTAGVATTPYHPGRDQSPIPATVRKDASSSRIVSCSFLPGTTMAAFDCTVTWEPHSSSCHLCKAPKFFRCATSEVTRSRGSKSRGARRAAEPASAFRGWRKVAMVGGSSDLPVHMVYIW